MFDYQKARESGYSDDDIVNFLSEKNPNFDTQKALESGYTQQEVIDFLSKSPQKPTSEEKSAEQPTEKPAEPEKGWLEKAGRVVGQYLLGATEGALLPYEMAVAPLAMKDAQHVEYRALIGQEIEDLLEKQYTLGLDPEEKKHLDQLMDLRRNPEKSEKFVQTADLGVRSLVEKATGIETQPENFAEKVASVAGLIKDPKKLVTAMKNPTEAKEVVKAIAPSGSELVRSIGIETAVEIAEDNDLGPVGKMAAVIIGDVAAHGLQKTAKTAKDLIKSPKETMAKSLVKLVPEEKQQLQKEIIESFRKSGIQADIGTITDSNLVKMVQTKLAQSGLTGEALDKLKQETFAEIRSSYNKIAESIGQFKNISHYEAGTVAKETIKNIQKKDLDEVRSFYKSAEDALTDKSFVDPGRINATIEKIQTNLKPGQLKSVEQTKVLDIIETLKRDISDSTGKKVYSKVKDLINNKIALNDMINYEVQGGTKQLLKELVGDIDRVIISYGKENPKFAKDYVIANKRFSEHAKTFRNKDISRLLREEDPAKLMNRMNSIDGMKKVGNILNRSKEGKELFDQLKRKKFEDLMANSMISNVEEQIKLGTFSNALSKPLDKAIAIEILGKQGFEKLQNIQKNAGILQKTAQKFYNTSQSGVNVVDAKIMGQGMTGLFYLATGNPWPFIGTAGSMYGAKKLSELITDKEFLKLVEDVIVEGKKKDPKNLIEISSKLLPYFKMVYDEKKESSQP